MIENPATSGLWNYKPISKELVRLGCAEVPVDMCAYGAPYLRSQPCSRPTSLNCRPSLGPVAVPSRTSICRVCVSSKRRAVESPSGRLLLPRSTRLPCVVLWHEQLGLPPLHSPSVNMANRDLPRDGKPPSTGRQGQLALMHRPSRPQPVRGALLLDGNRPSSSNSRMDQPSGDEPPWKRSRVEIRGSVANQINRSAKAARRAALLGPADDPATFLKQRTVTATTRILYLDCVESFCKEMGVRANELSVNFTPNEIDQLLERYLGELYVAGDGVAAARWALYALAWFLALPTKSPTILPRARSGS